MYPVTKSEVRWEVWLLLIILITNYWSQVTMTYLTIAFHWPPPPSEAVLLLLLLVHLGWGRRFDDVDVSWRHCWSCCCMMSEVWWRFWSWSTVVDVMMLCNAWWLFVEPRNLLCLRNTRSHHSYWYLLHRILNDFLLLNKLQAVWYINHIDMEILTYSFLPFLSAVEPVMLLSLKVFSVGWHWCCHFLTSKICYASWCWWSV